MQYKTLSFTSLLQSSAEMQNFLGKVDALAQLNTLIASKLEPSLASNCRVANLRDGILILATTSPAWNHKLRFYSVDLLSELRSDPRWSGLKSIEIRVDYLPNTESASAPGSKRGISISKENAELLSQLAETIANPKLAQALKRVSSKGNQQDIND
jgi:hypothetical protein